MPAPQQPNQSDNSAGILWGTAATFATIGVVWAVFKTSIISGYLKLKLWELDFLALFGNHASFPPLKVALLDGIAHPAGLAFSAIIQMGNSVGDWLRIPLVIILFLLGIVVYFSNTTRIYKKLYSMRELAKLEKNNWPQITPVVDLDLIQTDIDTGPWAMGMTPMQFCKRYRLLDEMRAQRTESMSRRDWDKIEVVLKRGEANKIFALQLGPEWKGVDKLPPYTRALFAAFAARCNSDTKGAFDLLMRLSGSATKTLNYSGVDELIKKHENTKLVQQVVQSHAYVLTVMASMLEAAREDGVQASADFLWLKPLDRKLWYILNTVGRQTPWIEVAGIFAHWIAEKEAGRKILIPMVEEATNAVELALKEVVYRPDEKV